MRVIVSRTYFGPNRFSDGPAAYLLVDSESWVAVRSAVRDSDLAHRLARMLPVSKAMSVSEAREAISTAIQSGPEAVIEGTIRRILQPLDETLSPPVYLKGGSPDQVGMLLACSDPEIGRRAGVLAVRLLGSLSGAAKASSPSAQEGFDFSADLQALERFAAARRPTMTEAAIIAAARERGIPVMRFDRWPFVDEGAAAPPKLRGQLQLGQGVFLKRIRGTESVDLPAPLRERLNNRAATYEQLSRPGVPTPARDPEFTNISSVRRALRSAGRIGYPLVLKPLNGSGDLGVTVNLRSDDDLRAAYEKASRYQRQIILERYIAGDTYRLLVMGGEVVAACQKPPFPATHGGGAEEVALNRFSPALKKAAVAAASCFQLSLAGIDFVTRDPGLSLEDSGGAVIGVDPAPDLSLHRAGNEQIPAAVARRFLAHLFPPGARTRIRIIAVTGTNGKTTTCRMIEKILREAGYRTGLACSDGVYVEGRQLERGIYSGIGGALLLFASPDVEVAVLETSRGSLLLRGLAFEQCDAAACTNVAEDHLGEYGVETVEQMAAVKRMVVEKASQSAVLNGDDENCLAMISHVKASGTWLVSHDARRPEIRERQQQGHGVVTVLEDGTRRTLTALRGDREIGIVALNEIPATFNGKAVHNVENAMFAVGLAMGFGVEPRFIQRGLRSFSASIEQTPSRLNIYDRLPFRVILDFAHNAHGLEALGRFLRSLDCGGRRIVVFYSRRDRAGVMPLARVLVQNFDYFVCRASAALAGDAARESAQTFADCLKQLGVSEDRLAVIPDMQQAVAFTLEMAQPGDLVLIKTQSLARALWDQLDAFRSARSPN